MSFGVLTLNLWNINDPLEPRYRALEAGLKLLRPDIVCLQEVYRDPKSGRSQSELIAAMCNLEQRFEANGLAILCSGPALRSDSVALPEFPGDGSRYVLFAELLVEGRPLLVANAHLAYPPDMAQQRRQQVEVLLAALKHPPSKGEAIAKILCGDLNDVVASSAVRAVLQSDEGFRDCFAECCPDNPGFTYSSRNRYVDRSERLDERIDYIFANSKLKAKNCLVVFDGNNGLDLVSDHFGVFCNLTFR